MSLFLNIIKVMIEEKRELTQRGIRIILTSENSIELLIHNKVYSLSVDCPDEIEIKRTEQYPYANPTTSYSYAKRDDLEWVIDRILDNTI